MNKLLVNLALGLVDTTINAGASALRTKHDFNDWEWEMLTAPVSA